MSPQAQIKAILEKSLPLKQVDVFGSQIIIEARSEAVARKAFRLLQQFCSHVHQPKQSIAYAKKDEDTNPAHRRFTVWLVGGRI